MNSVLFIRQTDTIYGVDTHILQLCRELPSAGFEPHLIVLEKEPRKPPDNPLVNQARRLGLDVHCLPANWAAVPGTIRAISQIIQRKQLNVVHAHEFKSDVMGLLAARLAGVPMVVTTHGSFRADKLVMRWMGALEIWSARSSNAVIVNTEYEKRRLLALRVPESAIRLIHYGIDYDQLEHQAGADRPAIRGSLGVDADEFMVLMPARLDPQKDQATLMEAFALAVKQRPALRLWLAGGDGEPGYLEALKGQAQRLAITGQVKFLGYSNRIPELLRACDLVAYSSRVENCPQGLLEAMALGCAVAAADAGGVPELVRPGKTGLLVRPECAHELAQAIIELKDDSALRQRLQHTAHAWIRQHHGLERQARGHAAVYREVIR